MQPAISFVDKFIERYCSELSDKHYTAVLDRLSINPTRKMTIANIALNRLRFIAIVAQFIFLIRFGKNEQKHQVYFVETVLDEERIKVRQHHIMKVSGESAEPLCVYNKHRVKINSLDQFYFLIKTWFSDLLFSLLSIFDFSPYQINDLAMFIYEKNILLVNDIKSLHIFSIHKANKYLLASWKPGEIITYVYFPNAPLSNSKGGYFSNVSFVLPGKHQAEELRIIQEKGIIVLNSVKVILAGNEFGLYVDNYLKNQKHHIGFFSEGWWARNENGLSIEEISKLKRHLDKPKSNYARLEEALLFECVRIATANKFSLALYLHPCEIRLQKMGVPSKHLNYIDNKNIFLGENSNGISNIYESIAGIVAMADSSIIADRYNVGLKTITCGYEILKIYKLDSVLSFYSREAISIESFEKLEEIIINLLSDTG